MGKPGRAIPASEVYRKQWTEWEDDLDDYKDMTALAKHFAFRGGRALTAPMISRFLNKHTLPSREAGYVNLYTMIGVARWRGLIRDKHDLYQHLEQWGLTDQNPDPSFEEIWRQIEEGIRAYRAQLKQPEPEDDDAPKPSEETLPDRLADRKWLVIAAPLATLVIFVILAVPTASRSRQDAAISLQNQLQSTSIAVLGGVPTAGQPVSADAIFATGTAIAATATAVATLSAQPTSASFPDDGVPMILIPSGCLWVGNYVSVRSSPVFHHCLGSFWMDEFKVSNEQYRQFTQSQPRSRSCGDYDWSFCANRPVENITWAEARDYCAARGAGTRLPTELEWEYAARGPLSNLFPWGNVFDPTRIDVRGQQLNMSIAPAEVDSFAEGRSWTGVVGLIGGVNEWTLNLWGAYPYQEGEQRVNDSDLHSPRVVRGASFAIESSLDDSLAAYNRDDASPGTRSYLTGFRCVRDA